MKNFEFKSQICTTKEQSERLLALGLKKETADCALFLNGNNEFEQLSKFGNWERYANMLPAWSLHRLIEMYTERYLACSVNLKIFTYEWLINEIEIHIKEGDFNKDYLEEKK
ncbi:MAG: hypothetical protein J6V44_12705 [Methanobrevibacter sp.]|nr:hypothetical protein [Methanobrevibacter sp.]